MNARFLTKLITEDLETEGEYLVLEPLRYYSKILNKVIEVPAPFWTDLSSVPRVPIIFWLWGGRAHHEGVLHDYLFREDSIPWVPFNVANAVFKEAMISRDKKRIVYNPMYWGVCIGGHGSYHRRKVDYKI